MSVLAFNTACPPGTRVLHNGRETQTETNAWTAITGIPVVFVSGETRPVGLDELIILKL